MDAMVPCEVRAAANVNETPWGVARRTSIEPRRARKVITHFTTWRVSTNQKAGFLASRSEIFRVHRANSLRRCDDTISSPIVFISHNFCESAAFDCARDDASRPGDVRRSQDFSTCRGASYPWHTHDRARTQRRSTASSFPPRRDFSGVRSRPARRVPPRHAPFRARNERQRLRGGRPRRPRRRSLRQARRRIQARGLAHGRSPLGARASARREPCGRRAGPDVHPHVRVR